MSTIRFEAKLPKIGAALGLDPLDRLNQTIGNA